MTKNIDQLISDLSRAPQPMHMPRSPAISFITWFLGACVYVGVLVAAHYSPRPDLAAKFMEPLFVAEFAALILLAAATSLSATLLSFPDMYQKRWLVYAPVGVFVLFALIVFLEWLADHPATPWPRHGMDCCTEIVLVGIPPAWWMFARIRRMAPVHPQLAGCNALLSSFSIGALVLRIAEPVDSINHLIVWHYLPMIMVGIIGLALGRKIFKW